MWMWLLLLTALPAGLVAAFGGRLQATGLWVGKALVPPEAATAQPRGVQDAVTAGWPSTLGLISSYLPFIVAALGFLHSWWLPVIVLPVSVYASVLSKRLGFVPRSVDWYLFQLLAHARRRQADYLVRGDRLRSDASAHLADDLTDVYKIYEGQGVRAPDIVAARAAPFGQPHSLLPRAKA